MDPSLTSALAPGVAIVISVGTFFFTQWRAQKIDDRAAAKSTVELLISENRLLMQALKEVRERVEDLESKFDDCERERAALVVERAGLQAQLRERR